MVGVWSVSGGCLESVRQVSDVCFQAFIEFTKQGHQNRIGMVVIRGNSVVMLEARDRI